jgi:hypothetical protein
LVALFKGKNADGAADPTIRGLKPHVGQRAAGKRFSHMAKKDFQGAGTLLASNTAFACSQILLSPHLCLAVQVLNFHVRRDRWNASVFKTNLKMDRFTTALPAQAGRPTAALHI